VPQTARKPPATLPGISFQVVPPPPPQVLPRMDIAGFVGFAASGPLGVPVAVEDSTQFAAIFGPDWPIAWDRVHNEQAYALLGPAVRAFFRNGGQRCWVVRVADEQLAQRDTFEVPGVAWVDQSGGLGAGMLRAASVGSWADGASVTAALDSAPLAVEQFWPTRMAFDAVLPPTTILGVGDLVRLRFSAQDAMLYGIVASLTTSVRSPLSSPASAQVQLGQHWWVRPAELVPGDTVEVTYLGADGTQVNARGRIAADSPADELTRLSFRVALSDPPLAGSLVVGSTDDGAVVLDVSMTEASAAGIVAIDCSAALVGSPPVASPPSAADRFGERLTLSLTVSGAGRAPVTLNGLGFHPTAPQFLGALPTDEAYYTANAGQPAAMQANFPLAGPDLSNLDPRRPAPCYVPLGATLVPSPPLGALYPATAALERDGLSVFRSGLFLDPALATEPTVTLLQTAGWIRDQSPDARPLQGIHALLDNDEVTLVAVPDAVQRGWTTAELESPPAPAPPEPLPPLDWSKFVDCGTRKLDAPQFEFPLSSPPLGEDGRLVHLTWSETDAPGAVYELQRASDPEFETGSQLYLGPGRQFDLSPPPAVSHLYLRVRTVVGTLQSPWSNSLLIDPTGEGRWFLDDPTPDDGSPAYSPQDLLEIQTAALRMCAARGDLLGLLALPEHYRASDAIAHAGRLRSGGDLAPGSGPDPIFGFGALYHPWLYCADPTDPTAFRRTSPDGPAAGIAALRAAVRGAWIAPANEPLQDVLALDRSVPDTDYQGLADAQINFVRDAPGGFLWLAADTLSDDPDLRPIPVRRLLALLRRTALQYGYAHVFEPNNDLSRRTARRSFQSILSFMFSAGAFAGSTAAQAFEVSTPLTPDDLDQGRLIVELKVAPSRPLAFLTVLLVQDGTGTVQVSTR
jgi:hypothetical protein